ncbi:MAG: helix-turn-helix transcriptional regulator [bacterium]|nr:helix-turn-helix transcriptional regulator [bacterium]
MTTSKSKGISIIAENIKKYRNKMGISQDKLSKLAGVTLHTITKIELGATPDPRINTVKRIADALNASIDDLLK